MSPVDLAGPPRRRECRDRGTARRCRPRRDPRRTDGRYPAPALTRGRVARGGGTKRGGGPLIASGGPPSRGGGLPRACAGHWCHPWRCGRLCGACSRVWPRRRGWCAVCRLRAWRWAGGGLGPASRPSSGDLGRHPGRAMSGYRRPQARSRDPVPGGPRILTRWCVARGGGAARCAGRRCGPGGAADGLVPPAPAARDRRPAGPRRRAVPARG